MKETAEETKKKMHPITNCKPKNIYGNNKNTSYLEYELKRKD